LFVASDFDLHRSYKQVNNRIKHLPSLSLAKYLLMSTFNWLLKSL
jgi:hypothetical protein